MIFGQDQAARIKRERDGAVERLRNLVQKSSGGKKPSTPTEAELAEARAWLQEIGEM